MKTLADVDVLVAGGGPAGIGAALGAARKGARTLLIETHAFFGGIASFGVGMCINQMRPAGQPRSDVHELVIAHLLKHGDLAVTLSTHRLYCNVEYLKVAVLDSLDEVGCEYLLHTRAVDALVEGGCVTGVVVATKQGLQVVRAKVVVDCTGDADVAFFAGAETMKDRDLSPMTLCLNVTNIDVEAALNMLHEGKLRDLAEKARAKHPLLPPRWGMRRFPVTNCLYINHAGTKAHGVFDGTDPVRLTQAEALSRRQALELIAALREFGGPTFRDVQLITTGAQVGVRETRRVTGLYVLTEEDAKEGRAFDDTIAWRSGFLDIGFVRYEPMRIHDVPYRAILPEKIDGLLVAGRCISATHVAASAGKSMGNCMATGHAAGLAAALSAQGNCTPRQLPVSDVQNALSADNVDLSRAGQEQDIES